MNTTPGLRIIGGRWRGRRLPSPEAAVVRPTPARLRETLFNWLQYSLAERRCLDLFAGSGVLGFEALSRGAKHASFVDCDARLCAELRKRQKQLGAGEVSAVVHSTAEHFLKQCANTKTSFDLVFIDPPFDGDLRDTTLNMLVQTPSLLGGNALVYVEHPKNIACHPPANWHVWRRAHAASVACTVFKTNFGEGV